MFARLFCTLIFWIVMPVIIAGSAVIVVCAYLPFVALKAAYTIVAGKTRLQIAAPTTTD